MDFTKKRNIKTITISLDRKLNNVLEEKDINKSKLVNFLIKTFFEKADCEEIIKNFSKRH